MQTRVLLWSATTKRDEDGPYDMHYSDVRKYWVKTHTRIRCEVVAADYTTASENDPRFFVSERCADEEDDESDSLSDEEDDESDTDSLCASDSEESVDFEGVEGCADIEVSDAESESSSEADARVQTEVCGGGWIERNRRLGLQRREKWAKRNDDCLCAVPPQSKDSWFDCESDRRRRSLLFCHALLRRVAAHLG